MNLSLPCIRNWVQIRVATTIIILLLSLNATAQLAPEILTQPVSQVVCPNASGTASFFVAASGTGISYQWHKNGVDIAGANADTFTILNVLSSDAGSYGVLVSNSSGFVMSNTVYLNVIIGLEPSAVTTCVNSAVTLNTTASGENIAYQWYNNTLNNNSNGTLISGATSPSYDPPVGIVGVIYYYASVNANGATCTEMFTTSAAVTVDPISVAGAVSSDQTICYNTSGVVSVVGSTGSIQWQESLNGTSNWINANGGSGAQTSTFTTPNLTMSTWYRAAVKNGTCAVVYSEATLLDLQSTTWNGLMWSNNLPTITTTAIINGNFTAAADLYACSLTILNNAVVNIPSGFDVTLYGALTVSSGSFTMENNSNLIQQSALENAGNIIIKRNAGPLMRLDYILWSAPVTGQNLQIFSPETLTNRFYNYNPATNLYNVVASPSTSTFGKGTSTLIRMPNSHSHVPTAWMGTFTGVPNNGPVDVAVTDGSFNTVGNPYPSTIKAVDFILANNLTAPLYFWRKTNNSQTTSYATYTLAGGVGTGNSSAGDPQMQTPNGILQVGQGFIIKATSPTITFNNLMRTGNNYGQFFKTTNFERNRIWLNLTNASGVYSQMLVSYMTGATTGVDEQLDGKYFNDSQIALNSLIGTEEFAIQARSLPFDTSDVVPLGFKAITPGTYNIALDNADGLFVDFTQPIILKDNLTNTSQNLREDSYSFLSEAGVFNARFELIYSSLLPTENIKLYNQILVYKLNQNIVIHSDKLLINKVEIYDLSGRLIANKNLVNAREVRINAGNTSQLLIIRITDADNNVMVKKLMN